MSGGRSRPPWAWPALNVGGVTHPQLAAVGVGLLTVLPLPGPALGVALTAGLVLVSGEPFAPLLALAAAALVALAGVPAQHLPAWLGPLSLPVLAATALFAGVLGRPARGPRRAAARECRVSAGPACLSTYAGGGPRSCAGRRPKSWTGAWAGPPHSPARARTGRPDNWVFVTYAIALTCAAIVALGIHWLDPPPLGRTGLAGLAAAGFLLAGLHLVRTPGRRQQALRQFLTDPRDRGGFEEAAGYADRIVLTWPALERLGDPTDPQETLERTLWDLVHALAERGELRAAARELRASVGEPIGAGLLFAAVTDRQAEITGRLTEVDAEVARRIAQLRHLAGLCQGFLDQRAAQSRARVRVDAADALLGAINSRRPAP